MRTRNLSTTECLLIVLLLNQRLFIASSAPQWFPPEESSTLDRQSRADLGTHQQHNHDTSVHSSRGGRRPSLSTLSPQEDEHHPTSRSTTQPPSLPKQTGETEDEDEDDDSNNDDGPDENDNNENGDSLYDDREAEENNDAMDRDLSKIEHESMNSYSYSTTIAPLLISPEEQLTKVLLRVGRLTCKAYWLVLHNLNLITINYLAPTVFRRLRNFFVTESLRKMALSAAEVVHDPFYKFCDVAYLAVSSLFHQLDKLLNDFQPQLSNLKNPLLESMMAPDHQGKETKPAKSKKSKTSNRGSRKS